MAATNDRTVEERAAELIESGATPIASIEQLRLEHALGLGELKVIVDEILPPHWRVATEALREAAWQWVLAEQQSDTPRPL